MLHNLKRLKTMPLQTEFQAVYVCVTGEVKTGQFRVKSGVIERHEPLLDRWYTVPVDVFHILISGDKNRVKYYPMSVQGPSDVTR